MTVASVALAEPSASTRGAGPRWVGHAGLAALLPAGAAVTQTLLGAVSLGVDWLELDVCATADGHLLLLHDTRLPSGRTVSRLTTAGVRRELPWALSLDEGVEILAGRVPILIDIKTSATIGPLGRWAARRADHDRLAFCTESAEFLRHMREAAPRIARWRSLPDIGGTLREHVARVAGALRSAASFGHIRDDLGVVLAEPGGRSRNLAGRLTAALYRHQLPGALAGLAAEVGATALCVEQWTVTAELCEAAHCLNLELAAWTVNDPEAVRRVARCGVDMITTDEVAAMRRALGSGRAAAPIPAAAVRRSVMPPRVVVTAR